MRFALILFLIMLWQNEPRAQTTEERPTLLIFSGSDWCIPCIQFEKTILSDSSVTAYVAQHLKLVKADFPQRIKLSADQQVANEALAERYNPEGAFPKILLLHPDQSIWAVLSWHNYSPESFTRQLDQLLSPH
ncbi:MAG: thioredoxin family protein [Lewinellaceae bacterium]|nr:thioredoxin family protein [Saprospiraceae bacterium]MCB9330130.1 thioredoxin family protein [Lewinellaceae bacterium]